jgi:hypothetical protein
MTRAATGDVVAVQPGMNIYSVLVIAAIIVQVLGLFVIFVRANELEVKFF